MQTWRFPRCFHILSICSGLIFSPLSSISAATDAAVTGPSRTSLELITGYSVYHLAPRVQAHLYGGAFESRYLGREKPFLIISDKILHQKEISVSLGRLQGDELQATSISITYGKRIRLPFLYIGFGIGPGTSYLFTEKANIPRHNYRLKNGFRMHLYYQFGSDFTINGKFNFTYGLKYNFTVKRFYLHNPFAKHEHEDLLNSFLLHAGLRWSR